MDLRMDARFNQVDSELTRMASDSNARFTGMNIQFTGLRTHVDSQLSDVDGALAKSKIRMEALHKNAMSRLHNILPGPVGSDDDLKPLFNLDTGEKIQENPTRALLDRMSSVSIENCLRGLGITPVGSKGEKLDQLRQAYGRKMYAYFG
ncbi:hypothetical protein E4U35_005161 [Claviceps purpurea]|nr:hypothetical protein E4U35_005161 [Claviceps purpurea]